MIITYLLKVRHFLLGPIKGVKLVPNQNQKVAESNFTRVTEMKQNLNSVWRKNEKTNNEPNNGLRHSYDIKIAKGKYIKVLLLWMLKKKNTWCASLRFRAGKKNSEKSLKNRCVDEELHLANDSSSPPELVLKNPTRATHTHRQYFVT